MERVASAKKKCLGTYNESDAAGGDIGGTSEHQDPWRIVH